MSGKKILIIDDERLLVKSTRILLERSGYTVEGALDGKKGLELMATL